MNLDDILKFKSTHNSDIYFNYNIKKLNWFNIGGKSRVFFKPKNLYELKEFLKLYSRRGKIFVIGSGSNILFKSLLLLCFVNIPDNLVKWLLINKL